MGMRKPQQYARKHSIKTVKTFLINFIGICKSFLNEAYA